MACCVSHLDFCGLQHYRDRFCNLARHWHTGWKDCCRARTHRVCRVLDVSLAFGLEAPTNLVQIVMGPGKLLRGVVRDVAGNPLSGVFVRTDMNFTQQIQTQFEFKTRTDDSGRFEWDSAPESPASYWFAADGFESVRDLELIADGSGHVVTLKRRGE